jgi:TrmH family RNA methyltransferase
VRFSALLLSIRDPGNLGTIIRTAEAAGADFVALSSDCADAYSSKVIRSSAGSIFRVRVLEIVNVADYLQQLKQDCITVYALAANATQSLNDLKPVFPSVIVIGSESHGLPKDILFKNKISIPMAGKVESLNAAVAASLAFYHFSVSLR